MNNFPTLTTTLRRYTSSIPITEMTAWEKGQMLVAALLGYPNLQGDYRPHDLPLNPQAIEAQELVLRLNRLVFDPSRPIADWRITEADESSGEVVGMCRFTDFVQECALHFNGLSGDDESDPESGQGIWNSLGQFLLLLLQKSDIPYGDAGDSLAADARRAHAYLDFPRLLGRLSKTINKERSGFGTVLLQIARKEDDGERFRLIGIKVAHIQQYINRWHQLHMQRGASALVYYTMVVLREALIRRFGPASIVHDYAGGLLALLPYRNGTPPQIDNAWVRQNLIDAFKPDGWFVRHLPRSVHELSRTHDPEFTLLAAGLPPAAVTYREDNLARTDMACWQWKEDAVIAPPAYPAPEKGSGSCPQCGLFEASASPFRFVRDPGRNLPAELCPVCNLITGIGPVFTHHFAGGLLELAGTGHNISLPWRRNRSQDIADADKNIAVFYTDGNRVGKLIGAEPGLHRFRRLALEIYRDVHRRLRDAVVSGGKDFVTASHVHSLDLLWIGGDDLVLRCSPAAIRHIEEAFGREGGLFSYTFESLILPVIEANRPDIMDELRGRVKAKKEQLKREQPE